jgi:hypothetical protein
VRLDTLHLAAEGRRKQRHFRYAYLKNGGLISRVWVSMGALTFCKGCPLRYRYISFHLFGKGHFLRISMDCLHLAGVAHEDVPGFPYILQRVPFMISADFLTLCKGYPLGYLWISLHFARGTP